MNDYRNRTSFLMLVYFHFDSGFSGTKNVQDSGGGIHGCQTVVQHVAGLGFRATLLQQKDTVYTDFPKHLLYLKSCFILLFYLSK